MRWRIGKACWVLLLVIGLVFAAVASPVNKLDPRFNHVLKEAETNQLIPVFVVMKEQVKVEDLTAIGMGMSKKDRRYEQVAFIKSVAENSQKSLMTWILSDAAKGKVENVKSLSFANGIAMDVSSDLVAVFAAREDVKNVLYDPIVHVIPDGEKNTEITSINELDDIVWSVNQIGAPDVWALGFNGEGVLVGVIDTGVNYNHTDLQDHLWDGGTAYPNHGYDFHNTDNDPIDDHGHGTHCSGTVLGDGTSGYQTGVAPEASLMCLKAINQWGGGQYTDMFSSVEFATEHGADIVSISLGWDDQPASVRATFRQTFDVAGTAGLITIAAAGNARGSASLPVPKNVGAPGICPSPWLSPDEVETGTRSGVITIGATDSNNNIADYSSEGPVGWGDVTPYLDYPWTYDGSAVGLIKPDVSAPGSDITSLAYYSNTGYEHHWDGTSMATPCVAGMVALLMQKNPDLLPVDVDQILQTTALDRGVAGKDNDYGAGIVRALEAVEAVNVESGTIQVTVKNANTEAVIPDVTVHFDEFRMETTDENGYCERELGVGTHRVWVEQEPYAAYSDETVAIQLDQTLEYEISLEVGHLVEPEAVNVSVAQESNFDVDVVLTNDGSAPLEVSFASSPDLNPIVWMDSLFTHPCENDNTDRRLRGIEFVNGEFFATGSNNSGNPNYIYVYDQAGELVRSFIQPESDLPDANGVGMYDLAFDGTNLYGGIDGEIIVFSPETGEVVRRFDGPYNPNRCLAYDSSLNVLWVGEMMRSVFGVNPETGEVLHELENDDSISSIFFVPNDEDGAFLYLINSERELSKTYLDKEVTVVATLDSGAGERSLLGACYAPVYDFYNEAIVGLLNESAADLMHGWRVSATVGWMAYDVFQTTIAPGASYTLPAQIQAQGLEMGDYSAYLLLSHNSLEGETTIPVSIEVTEDAHESGISAIPSEFTLADPWPNPFNASTRIQFALPSAQNVHVKLFDILGRSVKDLSLGQLGAGVHHVTLNAQDVASGVYFVQVDAETYKGIKKVVLIK